MTLQAAVHALCPCVPETDPAVFVQPFSCLGPHIGFPNARQAVPATSVTSKQSAVRSTGTIYICIWNCFHSLSAFKEQPRATTTHVRVGVCVGVRGAVRCWSAAVAWSSGWRRPLPITPRLVHLRNAFELDQNAVSTRFSFGLTAKVIGRQRYNQLLVQRRSFTGSRDHYGASIHIFVRSRHNFHTGSVWNMIGLLFKAQNGLCWTDFIIEQCSRPRGPGN